jgi:hypothetical protein
MDKVWPTWLTASQIEFLSAVGRDRASELLEERIRERVREFMG